MHEVIVVGVDGSPGGYAAVAEAAELAKHFNARLIAVSVQEGLPRYPATVGEVDDWKEGKDRFFSKVRAETKRIAGRHGARLEHEIRVGHAAQRIVEFASEVGADLVVLGYKDRSRVAQFLIRTTGQKVNAYAQASVLIVKPARDPESVWHRILSE